MKNFLTNRRNDFGFDLFDEFDNFFKPVLFNGNNNYMSTDVKESDSGYTLSVDIPGFEKKDIALVLKDGYLTVEANREDKDNENANYLRRERKISLKRSFYVGDAVTEEDISAKYDNGTLSIEVPKKDVKKITAKNIEIK